MEIFFQLVALFFVLAAGPTTIVILAARKGNLLLLFMNITDSQIFVALFVALFTGVLALRLGAELYKLFVCLGINVVGQQKYNSERSFYLN